MKHLFDIRARYFRLIALLSVITASALFHSCSDETEPPMVTPDETLGKADCISIQIRCAEPASRAESDEPTEDGIESLNENLIKSVTVCLAPSAGDRTDNDAPVYMQTFTGIDKQQEAILRIPLSMELITRLFSENSSSSCRVFAAVNVDPGEAKTVAELRSMVINSTFATSQRQASFAMDGEGTVSYMSGGNYAIGEVKVKRSAAKITLALDVDDNVEELVNGETLTWIPDASGIRVRLEQGVKTSTLDPDPTPNMDGDVYFNTANTLANSYNFAKKDLAADDPYARYNLVQNIPFYTYPNKWTGEVDEAHGTFMMLSVPWSSDGGKSWRTCYYHVPIIPFDQFELVRNISYHVNLHVGVLGSFVPEEPLEVEADYFVADWGQETIDVDIKGYRYLVVDQNEYTVNNENEINIPFYSSHKTKVISTTMTFYRYNFSDQGSEFAVTVTDKQNDASPTPVYTSYYDNATNTLQIKHDLVVFQPHRANGTPVLLTRNANGVREKLDYEDKIKEMLNTISYYTPTSDAEYSAIKFEVVVQHTDIADGETSYPADSYQEKIIVWQYPGMYITAKQNYCDNLIGNSVANAKLGNTFINGVASSSIKAPKITVSSNQENNYFGWGEISWYSDYTPAGTTIRNETTSWSNTRKMVYNYTNWDCSIGLGNATNYFNWNPNMYLVTITKLNDENFNIGDPRSYNINNDLSNNYGSYTVDGGTQKVFASQYWYYQAGNNNKGPETSESFNTTFYGQKNPLSKRATVSSEWWDEYIIQGFVSAPSLDGSNRTLRYYYPTREAEDNKNTLAPKFRICSSYAGSRAYMTREMSRRRAAAYQELGYCAGRWRLPTYGEVQFIMNLAAEEKIPRLFGTNEDGTWCYWCAQGAVIVPAGNAADPHPSLTTNPSNAGTDAVAPFTGDNYRARTRFVYDEWYWGSETLTPSSNTPNSNSTIYTFTWGDRAKSNPQD